MSGVLAIALLAVPDALSGPAPVSTDAVLAFAEVHAPRLRAADRQSEAAAARVATGDRWPEPQATVRVAAMPIETRNGPAWSTVGIGQRFPWLDALSARRDSLTADADVARAERNLISLTVQVEALAALHRLAASRAEAAINDEMRAIADRVLRTAEERLAVADARSDVIRAQVEVARLETVSIDLEDVALTRQAELNVAIGRDPLAPIGPLAPTVHDPVADLDTLLTVAGDHPALVRQDARVASARARLRETGVLGRPGLSIGVDYTVIGEPAGMAVDPGRDALGFHVGIELPLWNGAVYDAEQRSAAAAVEAERATRDATRDAVARQVVEQVSRADTALRRLRLYRGTALPLAEQDLELALAAYATGRAGFERVLDAERTREQFAVAAVRATADFAVARAMLARAVGQPLVPPTSSAGEME